MKIGIANNANYTTTNKTAFAAKLDLTMVEKIFKHGEVETLNVIASKIGSESDTIAADIGKPRYWNTGGFCEGGDDTEHWRGYSIAIATNIKGKLTAKLLELSEYYGNRELTSPFNLIKSFLEGLSK